jgi:SynChlorMet cassette protein ScmD
MKNTKKPIANPMIVCREEFDDWALLFDPDTGKTYGLNPVSVFIWKHLDGGHTVEDITKKLKTVCTEMPEEPEKSIYSFLEDLRENGLASLEQETE